MKEVNIKVKLKSIWNLFNKYKIGMLKDNLFHGKGIMYFNNGDIYSGKKYKNSIILFWI